MLVNLNSIALYLYLVRLWLNVYMAKMFFFFSFCIPRTHRRVFLKLPQNWALSFPRRPRPTRRPGVTKSGSGTGRDVTSGIVYSPRQFISVFHCISIQTRSFFVLFTPKNNWFCMEKQWNTEMKSRRTLKWRHGLFWTQT